MKLNDDPLTYRQKDEQKNVSVGMRKKTRVVDEKGRRLFYRLD